LPQRGGTRRTDLVVWTLEERESGDLCGPGKEGGDPEHFDNFRERIQGGQWRRESCAVGRAQREEKCDARHTLRRGSEDGQEPRGVIDRAVIQLRGGETDEAIVRGS